MSHSHAAERSMVPGRREYHLDGGDFALQKGDGVDCLSGLEKLEVAAVQRAWMSERRGLNGSAVPLVEGREQG